MRKLTCLLCALCCAIAMHAQVHAYLHHQSHKIALATAPPAADGDYLYDAVKAVGNGDYLVMQIISPDSAKLERWGIVRTDGSILFPPTLEAVEVDTCSSCPGGIIYRLFRVWGTHSYCATRMGFATRDSVLLQPDYHHWELYNGVHGPIIIASDTTDCGGDVGNAYLFSFSPKWQFGPFMFSDPYPYGFIVTIVTDTSVVYSLVTMDGAAVTPPDNVFYDPGIPDGIAILFRRNSDLPSEHEQALFRMKSHRKKQLTPWYHRLDSIPGCRNYSFVTHEGAVGVINAKGKVLWQKQGERPWNFQYTSSGRAAYDTPTGYAVVDVAGRKILQTRAHESFYRRGGILLPECDSSQLRFVFVGDSVQYITAPLSFDPPKCTESELGQVDVLYESPDPNVIHSPNGMRLYQDSLLLFRHGDYQGIARRAGSGTYMVDLMEKCNSIVPLHDKYLLNRNSYYANVTQWSITTPHKLAMETQENYDYGYWGYDATTGEFEKAGKKFMYGSDGTARMVAALDCRGNWRSLPEVPGYVRFVNLDGQAQLIHDSVLAEYPYYDYLEVSEGKKMVGIQYHNPGAKNPNFGFMVSVNGVTFSDSFTKFGWDYYAPDESEPEDSQD